MTEFISLRQDVDSDGDKGEDEDGLDFDGIKDYDGNGKKAKYSEKDIKEALFPRDYFKAFL